MEGAAEGWASANYSAVPFPDQETYEEAMKDPKGSGPATIEGRSGME